MLSCFVLKGGGTLNVGLHHPFTIPHLSVCFQSIRQVSTILYTPFLFSIWSLYDRHLIQTLKFIFSFILSDFTTVNSFLNLHSLNRSSYTITSVSNVRHSCFQILPSHEPYSLLVVLPVTPTTPYSFSLSSSVRFCPPTS